MRMDAVSCGECTIWRALSDQSVVAVSVISSPVR